MNLRRFISILFSLLLVGTFALSNYGQKPTEFSQADDEFSQTDDEDPTYLFNKGQDAHAAGDFLTALKFYEQAIALAPKFPEAEYQRAMVFILLENTDAEKSLRRTIEIAPDWALPKISLAKLLFAKSSSNEVESLLTSALSLEPQNSEALSALAELYLLNNNVEHLNQIAKALDERAIDPPRNISFWITKSEVEKRLGKYSNAIGSVNRGLALKPQNFNALVAKINLHLLLKENENALETAKALFSVYPKSEAANILIARSFLALGEEAKAIASLKAYENPTSETEDLLREIEAGENIDVNKLQKLLEKEPNNVLALGQLCAATRTTDAQKALDYCLSALKLDSKNIKYAVGYGAALVQLKRFSEAATVLTNLLKYDSENYTLRANLATALFQMKRFDLARREYEWITKKRPNQAFGFYFLGISYDRLGEFELAHDNYQKFLELANDAQAKLEIEKVKLRLPFLIELLKEGKGKKPQ